MKTKLPFLLVLLFVSKSLLAQIPNPSFEFWTNSIPLDWSTNSIPTIVTPVTQSTDAYSGTYAIKGEVVNYMSTPFPPSVSATGTGNGFPVTQAPTSLSGWYKTNMIGTDAVIVEVGINDNTISSIGTGFGYLGTSTNYAPFTIPINYFSGTQAATASIFFSIIDSTGAGNPHVGSTFLIDDLTFESSTNIISVNYASSLSVFPNPVSDLLSIQNIFKPHETLDIKLINAEGKLVLRKNVQTTSSGNLQPVDLTNLPDGNYIVLVHASNKSFAQKLIVQH